MAYKPAKEIVERIKDTVDINFIIKPAYILKAVVGFIRIYRFSEYKKIKVFNMLKNLLLFMIFAVIVVVLCQCPSKPTETTTTTIDIDAILYKDMISVNGGQFIQGNLSDNTFDHTVSAFEIGKYEVTYELWFCVRQWAENNGYKFYNKGREGNSGGIGTDPSSIKHRPVTCIWWYDTIVWCNAYSEMLNKIPVYYSDEFFKIPLRYVSYIDEYDTSKGFNKKFYILWDSTNDGYRLPTEGEWDFSARYIDGLLWTENQNFSGSNDYYSVEQESEKYGWYEKNAFSVGIQHPDYGTHKVGEKSPNKLEIFDMTGNVSEFCWDWYSDFPDTEKTDYRGPQTGIFYKKIIRSGSWRDNGLNCQVGRREAIFPDEMKDFIGFRVAKSK